MVWTGIKPALRELKESQARVIVSRGIGKVPTNPHLFWGWAFTEDLKNIRPLRWSLLRGIPIERLVDDDEMTILSVEIALGEK